jgi:hypothetical protein
MNGRFMTGKRLAASVGVCLLQEPTKPRQRNSGRGIVRFPFLCPNSFASEFRGLMRDFGNRFSRDSA